MSLQDPSRDLSETFLSLVRLLTHKVEDTLPPELHSVYWLNLRLRQNHSAIVRSPEFYDMGNSEFRDTFLELGTIIVEWGEFGGRSMEDRVELAVVMEELMNMQGIRRENLQS